MAPNRGNMNHEMWRLARRMNQLMDEWMHAGFRGDVDEAWQPAVDIIEGAGHICVLAELAGMSRDEIRIEVDRDAVTLSGFRALMPGDDQTEVRQLELARGAFRRTLQLPFEVDPDKAQTTYEAGLLEIRFPKPESPG